MKRAFFLVVGLVAAASGLSRAAVAQTANDFQVERAGRHYRLWLYETFRHDRAEFDRRHKAGQDLLKQWRLAGEPADSRDQVLAWFAAATPQSASSASALPALPEIAPNPARPQQDLTDAAPLPPFLAQPAAPARPRKPAAGGSSTPVSLEKSPGLAPPNLDEPAENSEGVSLFQSFGSAILRATGLQP